MFPEYAKVGKIIAKENFYGNIDTATKNLFQSEIASIVWEYKLAPNTINLQAKKWPEVEVFRITLKNSETPEKVLKAIDSAIPYPILFLIEKGSIEKSCDLLQGTKPEKRKYRQSWHLFLYRMERREACEHKNRRTQYRHCL